MNWLEKTIENPGKMKLIKRIFFGGLILAVLTDLILVYTHQAHGHLWLENLPAFGAVAGLVSAIFIVAAAKIIINKLFTKKEDYYD